MCPVYGERRYYSLHPHHRVAAFGHLVDLLQFLVRLLVLHVVAAALVVVVVAVAAAAAAAAAVDVAAADALAHLVADVAVQSGREVFAE